MTEHSMAAFIADMATKILEHGHGIIWSTTDDGHPFAYTVGRTTVGRPELIVAGSVPQQVAGAILNLTAAQDDEHGNVRPGAVLDEIIANFKIEVADADVDDAPIFMARRFYGDDQEIRLHQLLLPDVNGRYPGEEGFDMPSQLTWPKRAL